MSFSFFFGRKLFFLTLSYSIKKSKICGTSNTNIRNLSWRPPLLQSHTAAPIVTNCRKTYHTPSIYLLTSNTKSLHNHVRSELLKQTTNKFPHPYNLNPKMGSSNSTSLIFNFTLIYLFIYFFSVVISKRKLKTWNWNYSLFFHTQKL